MLSGANDSAGPGSTREVEHYCVDLRDVAVLELVLTPDRVHGEALATLAAFHMS